MSKDRHKYRGDFYKKIRNERDPSRMRLDPRQVERFIKDIEESEFLEQEMSGPHEYFGEE